MSRIGTRIGNFVLKKQLGAGGMGEVYYAEHVSLDEARVYKILMPQLVERTEIVERFEAEARAAAAIKHKNIMRARDFGHVGNTRYIEMDWFEGETLTDRMMAQRGPMPASMIIAIMGGIASGIQAAHERNIIHRDLKPENIFVATVDGVANVAKVLDFGVAKLHGVLANGSTTQAGTMIGTPAYAAPEQFDTRQQVTHAADIWALGVLAYEMATGALPFQTEPTREAYFSLNMYQIGNRLFSEQPVDPRTRNPNLPPKMAEAILRALHRDPAQRYESARAFVFALAESIGPEALKILRKYAGELFDDNNMLETVRQVGRGAPTVARYTFDTKLGQGGMAEVYVGTQTGEAGFHRRVAIKRVLAHFSALPKFAEMFIAEAQVASQLSHPNIVTVLDFAKDKASRLFLVMEYVEGKDLTALVKRGALPPSLAIHIGIQILLGLGHAHAQRVLHRDVSPHNVLLSWSGAVKVSDFGIAKVLDQTGSGQSLVVKGKPGYMAPEQAQALQLDGRTDLYAVGVVLWELVTGRRLFTGGPQETFEVIVHRAPPPPSSARPVPRDLEAVIMRLLARDKEARYLTAEDAIEALKACIDAPRDGHGELVRALAERFPEDAPRLPASLARAPSAPIPHPSEAATVTAQPRVHQMATVPAPAANLEATIRAPASPTTLRTATGQSMPQTPEVARKGPRWPIVAGTSVVAIAGGLILLVASRKGSSPTAADEPTRTPAAAVAIPVVADAMVPPDASTSAAKQAPDAAQLAAAPDAAVPDASLARPDAAAALAQPRPADVAVHPVARTPAAPPVMVDVEFTASEWAAIYVDGKMIGQTPKQATLSVGRHKITMKHLDKQKTMTINVTKDKPLAIDEDVGTW